MFQFELSDMFSVDRRTISTAAISNTTARQLIFNDEMDEGHCVVMR